MRYGIFHFIKRGAFLVVAFILLLTACYRNDYTTSTEDIHAISSRMENQYMTAAAPPMMSTGGIEQETSTELLILSAELSKAQLYAFHDVAIMESIERYFDKSACELTQEDYSTLSKLHAFNFDIQNRNIRTLRDLPVLFPEIRYVSLAFFGFDEAQISQEDCLILENMESLRAVEIYCNVLPSLDFIKDLPYVSICYADEAILSGESNLSEASVLGKDFIESCMSGNVREYMKVADGERVYELIVTKKVVTSFMYELYEQLEAVVFISEYENDEYQLLESVIVPGRIGNLTGGLILTDVNFDGEKDVLVSQGHFGNQGLVTFACFIQNDGKYDLNTSFSDIPNPAIDGQNKKVLSTWRNMAVSHSWAMYSHIDGVFVQTDCLTQEPEDIGEGFDPEIYVWRHEVEHFYDGNTEVEIYLTSEYIDDEWIAMFYDENSYWGLFSDKWRTLHNQGTLLDWSIYGDGTDFQIMEIISN